jgi:non-canonical purine NTP pyrophosphatase (RdgB/HAM1 family)
VTTNSWKYQQGQSYLQDYEVSLQQAEIELPESRSEDVLEIAREKAEYAFSRFKKPVIVIDGAFHIKALNGFPRTFVKFSEKYIGASGVIKLMEGKEDRSYEWPNVLYYRDANTEKYFVGYIRGQIIQELPDNTQANDFGLIQMPDGYTKTFSDMTSEELRHFEAHVWSPTLFKEFAEWYAGDKK